MYPYKVQVVQELEYDKWWGIEFCSTFLLLFKENDRFSEKLTVSDEVCSEITGYMNKQKKILRSFTSILYTVNMLECNGISWAGVLALYLYPVPMAQLRRCFQDLHFTSVLLQLLFCMMYKYSHYIVNYYFYKKFKYIRYFSPILFFITLFISFDHWSFLNV